MVNRKWFHAGWPPIAAILLILTAWQAATRLWAIPPWLLPSPLDIAYEAYANVSRVWMHTAATIQITMIGFAIGAGIGFALAVVLHLLPWMKSAVYPILVLSQNIPIIALAPLLMIWFGFGLLPKMVVITLVCFFPVAIAAMGGLAHTDPAMLNYLRMVGANKWQVFIKLELPYSLSSLFSGLKISATYSVMGAVIAEWLGSDKGIGVYMLLAKSAFRTDRVFVAIVIVVTLSLLLFGLITLLEKLVIRWRPVKETGARRG